MIKIKSIKGCLLGTAVGDAVGLPYEGLTANRQLKMYPSVENYHFLFGKGMISDDTEHTLMVAQSLIESAGNIDIFPRTSSKHLKLWLLALPAGIGLATLKAILKLCVGIKPDRSGVFSAGNGPAMRSAILGVVYGHDNGLLQSFIQANTRITHTDPKAEIGSMAVAVAAYMATDNKNVTPDEYYTALEKSLNDYDAKEFLDMIKRTIESVGNNQPTQTFMQEIGLGKGISGYIYHTVPAVVHCWLRNQNDMKTALMEVVKCGGDTDSTAAILGGIIGSNVGKEGIPTEWIENLLEFPRTVKWMENTAEKLYDVCINNIPGKQMNISFPAAFLRNIFFTIIVLLHGFRRLLPPY